MGRRTKSEEDAIFSRIEHYRGVADMTRQQLADAVGVHYQTIGYIERGEYSPSLVLALKFAKVLNTTVDELFQLGQN